MIKEFKTIKDFCDRFEEFNIYNYLYYIGITSVKEDISDKDLLLLINKCSELSGEYIDPIELGYSLADAIYDNNLNIEYLKKLSVDDFYDWYNNGREIGQKLIIDEEEKDINDVQKFSNVSVESNTFDVFELFKNMSDIYKNNLKKLYILDGIYTSCPNISKDDAQFIYNTCEKIHNENINPFSISHYITDNYMSGNITKNDLEKATSGDICSAVYFDKLDYLHSESDKQIEEEFEK